MSGVIQYVSNNKVPECAHPLGTAFMQEGTSREVACCSKEFPGVANPISTHAYCSRVDDLTMRCPGCYSGPLLGIYVFVRRMSFAPTER